jgi:hypothetical protein
MVEIGLQDDYVCSEGLNVKRPQRTYVLPVALQFYWYGTDVFLFFVARLIGED